jgi:hypothetical protein
MSQLVFWTTVRDLIVGAGSGDYEYVEVVTDVGVMKFSFRGPAGSA